MSEFAINAEGLGKKYLIGHQAETTPYLTLRYTLARKAKGLVRRTKGVLTGHVGELSDEIWAVHDVSFSVRHSDVVGIIGRNGAGKSTLLKLVSRITEPSAGRVTVCGRVASLLEVGTGFHLELTGRENVFLNGAILGMTRADIRRRFDEIVAFAEVEKFLDTPVKHYSSGMRVRLAFSVAAHLEPDILIVDEVLAVGDAEFQKKSLGKIGTVSSQEGRTVLLVSHQMGMITALCKRALLLEHGELSFDGAPADAVAAYYGRTGNQPYSMDFTKLSRKVGDEFATLLSAAVEDMEGRETGEIEINCSFKIRFSFALHRHAPCPPFPVIHVYNSQGQCAFVSIGVFPMEAREGIYESSCVIPKNFLNDDIYSIDLILTYTHAGVHECFNEKSALTVVVVDPIEDTVNGKVRNGYRGSFAGAVRPELSWQTRQVS